MTKVRFKTHVLLKSIIGKDLITDDNIAVLELVKNAFDANSKNVQIIFDNLLANDDKLVKVKPTERTSKIVIQDIGKGMSESDIVDKWLNIAYSEKKAKREEFGRILAGNKGVGRFSCDRLGQYLNIFTKKQDSSDILHLFIDWNRFEVEDNIDLKIQDVELETNIISLNDFQQRTGYDIFNKGTILEISKLREDWTHNKIINLKRQLEKLINPNQAFKRGSFNIEIVADEFLEIDNQKREEYSKINGRVNNRIFENLNFRTATIESKIDSIGNTIKTTLSNKGREVFTLTEKNIFPLLKDIKITLYYLNTYSKIYFAKQTGIRSVDFGSIYLFINGFRVPPYGDQGDDWLGMEIRKGQGHSRHLGTRETVGRIEITDTDDHFKIISSRSGVVNNSSFTELTRTQPYGYFFKTFRRLERFVVEGIKFDSTIDKESIIQEKIRRAGQAWNEENEEYAEDILTKNKRVLSLINNIIGTRSDDVIKLDINEEFVQEIIEEEVEKSEKEFDIILNEIDNSNLGPNEISSLINKLENRVRELGDFSTTIENYTNDATNIKASNFDELKNLYKQKQKEFLLEKQLLEARLTSQEEERKKLAEEQVRLANELEAEKKESLFNKKLAGTDIAEVINLQHHIDRAADKINSNINNLIAGIEKNASKTVLLKYVEKISLENKKIASIAQFVSNANFNLKATDIKKDLNRFIREYIINVHQEYDHLKINRQLLQVNITSDNIPFVRSFRPLEIIIIIDNLFSNSYRANAKNIQIDLKTVDKVFTVKFSDDGKGITDDILPRIFNIGFTTTTGSGIGLFHIKQILERIKGEIKVNNQVEQGIEFEITIPGNEA